MKGCFWSNPGLFLGPCSPFFPLINLAEAAEEQILHYIMVFITPWILIPVLLFWHLPRNDSSSRKKSPNVLCSKQILWLIFRNKCCRYMALGMDLVFTDVNASYTSCWRNAPTKHPHEECISPAAAKRLFWNMFNLCDVVKEELSWLEREGKKANRKKMITSGLNTAFIIFIAHQEGV